MSVYCKCNKKISYKRENRKLDGERERNFKGVFLSLILSDFLLYVRYWWLQVNSGRSVVTDAGGGWNGHSIIHPFLSFYRSMPFLPVPSFPTYTIFIFAAFLVEVIFLKFIFIVHFEKSFSVFGVCEKKIFFQGLKSVGYCPDK